MHVLALNPGSSTLKFRLCDLSAGVAGGRRLAEGLVEHVAGATTTSAAEQVLQRCLPLGVVGVGCRVVHGGPGFAEPALLTAEVLAEIRALARLAPLHNPIAAAVLEAGQR